MENPQVTISVIVPLYNKAPYVEKCLNSILSQTYRDFELIIVDDGSIDNSPQIAQSIINNHHPSAIENRESRIRNQESGIGNRESGITNHQSLIIHQPNSGVAAARNNGVLHSHGTFLCFLDADDWWEPTFLEEMLAFTHEYPDAGLYASNYIYYKPGKTRIGVHHPTGYMNYPKCYYENVGMPVWTGAVMMPRTIFDEMKGFPVGIRLGEDFLLWAKIAHHHKIAFLNCPLTYYNNDVPASLRATRNLHAPEHHMLWYVDPLITDHDWRTLIDTLRASGLKDYWLSPQYHDIAKIELAKIDWSNLPKSAIRDYQLPIWLVQKCNSLLRLASRIKHLLR